MSLGPGARLGPYEIISALGAGGMGEVYRATDTTLGRQVAIKVLPDGFANDPDRLARFEREAKTLAALNHPNIAQIFGLERSGTTPALVMELIEGEDLSQRIARGPIAVDEALPIAKQLAEALEAAHEQGIVHRDLKPANIKVTPDGRVKVLDFGLAKLTEAAAGSPQSAASLSLSPTITSPAMMTGVGMLLGTAAYMSPEQAKGRPADKRSDIWAFGCVLFEMLTGKLAFDAEDVTDTLAAILMREPDWSSLPATVPPAIRTLIRRCVEKNPQKRIRDASVALFAMQDLGMWQESPAAATTPAPSDRSRQSAWRWMATHAVALLLGITAMGAAVWLTSNAGVPRTSRFAITPSGTAAITAIALDRELAITAAGTHVVYVGNSGTQLFVRALDQLDSKPLSGLGTPRGPFLSPDGQWIGFFDGSGADVTIKKVTLTGGPAVTISRFTNSQRAGATWGENGTIVFATTDQASGLWRVSEGGGTPTMLTKPDHQRGEGDHLWPEFLPGSQAVLFTITPLSGPLENSQVAVLDLRSGQKKILVQGGSDAHYAPSGHLVYGVGGTLRAVTFDLRRLEVTGTPVPVLSQAVSSRAGAANFDVARDGTLAYVMAPSTAAAGEPQWKRTLVWVDRQGHQEAIPAPARAYASPRLSPDGTRIATSISDQEDDIWIWSLVGQTLTRFTFGAALDDRPTWTPDGRRVVFSSSSGGAPALFAQAADGTGVPTRLSGVVVAGENATAISPDGASVLFDMGNDVMMAMLKGERRTKALVNTTFRERNGEISPDGRWLAYDADDSGRFEIYVRPFPDMNGGRWQISTAGGVQPTWARNGQELFYLTPSGALMRVAVDGGATWKPNTPTRILETSSYFIGIGPGGVGRTYDVSVDGKRFLMIKRDSAEPSTANGLAQGQTRTAEEGLVVVQNWGEELKRLVPTK